MLYRLDKHQPASSTRITIKPPNSFNIKEKDIEVFLMSRLSEIVSEDHLMLIGQERQRQEEADLLALDETGRLYIFELKRWESNTENILQVMRYGQIFGRYTYEELQRLAGKQKKLEGSLKESHQTYFELDSPLDESKFNHDQEFVLVTNGLDADTISAIEYWAKKGVKITCSPYRIYDINGQPYIQFDTYNPDGDVILETDTQYFIVNTNHTYMESAWASMLGNLKEGRASAYYDRKYSICNIPKKSTVYLYHTGTGVIGKGMATDSYRKADYHDDADAEYYVPLNFSWAVDQANWSEYAVRAWEINARLDAGHRFRQTVFSVSREMADAIDEIYEDKQGG